MAGGEDPGGGSADLLRELEQRLERASAAAERLAAEAARAAADRMTGAAPGHGMGDPEDPDARPRPPASGWQQPRPGGAGARRPAEEDLEALLRLLRGLGEALPPELRRSLSEALRELLQALRALIDWSLERIEQRARSQPEVQDIPIL